MFFAKPGIYEPCGIFSITHIIVLVICLVLIGIFVYKIRNITAKKLNLITRIIAIVIVFLETGKIVFSFVNHQTNLDSWVPLYFCSMFIFATILSGYTKGWLKSLADAFIGSGGIIAGAMFLIMPSTSLTIYPMFHYLSCYSMLYHSPSVTKSAVFAIPSLFFIMFFTVSLLFIVHQLSNHSLLILCSKNIIL